MPDDPDQLNADRLEQTAHLLSVIAHPVRLAALLLLDSAGPSTVSDLVQRLDIEQSGLSHHLRLLRDAGLVLRHSQGRNRIYSVADHHVAHIVRDAYAHAQELQELQELSVGASESAPDAS